MKQLKTYQKLNEQNYWKSIHAAIEGKSFEEIFGDRPVLGELSLRYGMELMVK